MKTDALAATNKHDPDRLLRKPAVKEIVPFSDTTMWRRVREGTFPRPIKISPGVVAWRESDIQRWISERAAAGR